MEIARARIAEEAERRTGTLDLAGLGLERLPETLFALTHLRVLLLGAWLHDGSSDRNSNKLSSQARDLARLRLLQRLELQGSDIADLTPLAALAQLQHLSLTSTEVADLAPLAALAQLQHLSLTSTKVADLAPLAALAQLQRLYLTSTKVADLAPLAALAQLQHLYLAGTEVADLAPLTLLPKLRFLDASGCRLQGFPPALLAKASLTNLVLHRTSIPGIPAAVLSQKPNENCLATLRAHFAADDPPDLPPPGAGRHVAVDGSGRIALAAPADLDQRGNNLPRLRALHPELQAAARDLVAALAAGNQPHGRLLDHARRYHDAVAQQLEAIEFVQLFALGTRLDNAIRATRTAAARTAADDPDGAVPPLAPDADEAAGSVLALHGPFILATRDGLEMLDAEERLDLTPAEIAALRAASIDFGAVLQAHPDLVRPNVAEAVQEAAEAIGDGRNVARGAVIGLGATRPVIIALATCATVVSLPFLGAVLAGPTGMVAGGVAALFGNEAVKKAKAFEALRSLMTRAIDQVSEADPGTLLRRFRDQRDLLLGQAPLLQRLEQLEGPFGWLGGSLAWLRRRRDAEATAGGAQQAARGVAVPPPPSAPARQPPGAR